VSGCDQSAVGCAESVDFCDESAALRWEDGTHSVIKTEAEDVSEEVNGVACFVLFGPSPVMVFDEVF